MATKPRPPAPSTTSWARRKPPSTTSSSIWASSTTPSKSRMHQPAPASSRCTTTWPRFLQLGRSSCASAAELPRHHQRGLGRMRHHALRHLRRGRLQRRVPVSLTNLENMTKEVNALLDKNPVNANDYERAAGSWTLKNSNTFVKAEGKAYFCHTTNEWYAMCPGSTSNTRLGQGILHRQKARKVLRLLLQQSLYLVLQHASRKDMAQREQLALRHVRIQRRQDRHDVHIEEAALQRRRVPGGLQEREAYRHIVHARRVHDGDREGHREVIGRTRK